MAQCSVQSEGKAGSKHPLAPSANATPQAIAAILPRRDCLGLEAPGVTLILTRKLADVAENLLWHPITQSNEIERGAAREWRAKIA